MRNPMWNVASAPARTAKRIKKWGRTYHVNKGDIVLYNSPNEYLNGNVGIVTETLSRHRCVVRIMNGENEGCEVFVYTAKPLGHNPRTQQAHENLRPYLTQILIRAEDKAQSQRPRKQKVAVEIKGRDEILAHLTGEKELGVNEFPVIIPDQEPVEAHDETPVEIA